MDVDGVIFFFCVSCSAALKHPSHVAPDFSVIGLYGQSRLGLSVYPVTSSCTN